MDEQMDRRRQTLFTLTYDNANTLWKALTEGDPQKRMAVPKLNGEGNVTEFDYELDLESLRRIRRAFPEDCVCGEEIKFPQRSRFWFFQDPVEDTNAFSAFRPDPNDPTSYKPCATPGYMASYVDRGEHLEQSLPFMFGYAALLEKDAGSHLPYQVYTGGVGEGVFLNAREHNPEKTRSEIVIGLNDGDFKDELSELVGFKWSYRAGAALWLLLNRHVGGLYLQYRHKNAEEIPCIVAAALAMGAHVTMKNGSPFRIHLTEPDPWERVVISFDHIVHRQLLEKRVIVA